MGPRLQLQALLEQCTGNPNVYFQAPSNMIIQYPCIVYARDRMHNLFADNFPYQHTKRYQVTIIDQNPDSDIPDRVAHLPMTYFIRHFVTQGLHHDVYSLYF